MNNWVNIIAVFSKADVVEDSLGTLQMVFQP